MAKLRVHGDSVCRVCRHGVLGTNGRPVGGRLGSIGGRGRDGDGSGRVGERRAAAASGLGGATNILLVLSLGRRAATAAAENNDNENDAADNGGDAPIPPQQTRGGDGGLFAHSVRRSLSDSVRVSCDCRVDPHSVLTGRHIDAICSRSSANGLSSTRVSLGASRHQSSQEIGAAHLIRQRASRVALTRVGASLAGNGAGAQIERRKRARGESALTDCWSDVLLASIEQHAAGIGRGGGGGTRGAETRDDISSSGSFGRAVGGDGDWRHRGREHKGLGHLDGGHVDSSSRIAGIHPETSADAALLARVAVVAQTEKKGARRIVGAARVKGTVAGSQNHGRRDKHTAAQNVAVDRETNLPDNVGIAPGNGNLTGKRVSERRGKKKKKRGKREEKKKKETPTDLCTEQKTYPLVIREEAARPGKKTGQNSQEQGETQHPPPLAAGAAATPTTTSNRIESMLLTLFPPFRSIFSFFFRQLSLFITTTTMRLSSSHICCSVIRQSFPRTKCLEQVEKVCLLCQCPPFQWPLPRPCLAPPFQTQYAYYQDEKLQKERK